MFLSKYLISSLRSLGNIGQQKSSIRGLSTCKPFKPGVGIVGSGHLVPLLYQCGLSIGKDVRITHNFPECVRPRTETPFVSKSLCNSSISETIQNSSLLFLCLSPSDMKQFSEEGKRYFHSKQLVLSCSNGISSNQLKDLFPAGVRSLRCLSSLCEAECPDNSRSSLKGSVFCYSPISLLNDEFYQLKSFFDPVNVYYLASDSELETAHNLSLSALSLYAHFVKTLTGAGISKTLPNRWFVETILIESMQRCGEMLKTQMPEEICSSMTENIQVEGLKSLNNPEFGNFVKTVVEGHQTGNRNIYDEMSKIIARSK